MACKVRVVKKNGRKMEYKNAVVKKEKGMLNIYELDDISACMKPVVSFDPCKLEAIYLDKTSMNEVVFPVS